MKRVLLLFIIALTVTPHLFAQTYAVKGKVQDTESSDPIPFAQVAFYPEGQNTPAAGNTTSSAGNFSVPLKSGSYKMVVSFVGYKDYQENVTVRESNVSVGTIRLGVAKEVMDEVVVTGNEVRQPVRSTMQGLEIRPDATISNIGGSLLDVLRNTPSVNVTDDGSVTLRGSGSTNILIDGRNSALASDLEQIPASAIAKVEIINNPNAKYDASSDGGVINIILKKGNDLGTTGAVEITTGTRMRTNATARVNRRTENYAVYGGYSYRSWPRVGNGSTQRTEFDENRTLDQTSERENQDFEHTLNYGGDYYFGKNKISFEGVFNAESENDFESTAADLRSITSDEPISQYVRNNNETEENYTFDNALIYERTYDDPDKTLRFSASTSLRDQTENQLIEVYNNTLEYEGREIDREEQAQTLEKRNTSVLQLDYATPSSLGLVEIGYKSIFRKFDNDYDYEIFDEALNEFTNLDSVSNRFIYQDQIHAAYAIVSDSLGSFNYALGLRAEQTFVDTELTDTQETNEQTYLNFFPSVQTSYALNDENILKATYSRRIDRPSAWRLNPFPDFADSLNVRIGDPNLQPEYINSFELGHMITTEKGGFSLTTTAFYRRTEGAIDWIVDVRDGISFRGPQNLNSIDLYGIELINTTDITDWWVLNASYSIFESQVDGTNIDSTYTNRGLSWYAKVTTDINLPYDINLQLTGNYTAPEIEAQGRDLARYYIDASLQRYFLDKQLSVSASFRDIFDTRNFRGENSGEDFSQEFLRKRETRIVLLTLAYNFKDPL